MNNAQSLCCRVVQYINRIQDMFKSSFVLNLFSHI